MKVNVDQFALDTRMRGFWWQWKRRYPFSFMRNRIEWYAYPQFKVVPRFPLHVDFEISSLCNLQCPMCYRPHRTDSNDGFMDLNAYKQGVDECAKFDLYSIRLSWRGEPTMHSDLVEMVRYAKEKGIKEVSFITNGFKLDEKLSHDLVTAGIDYFSVSIDGVGEKYNEIRYPSRFDEMVKRLKNMRELRDTIGGGYPRIRINSIWSAIKDTKQDYYNTFSPIVDFITVNPDYDHSLKDTGIDPDHVCQYLYQRLTVMWDGTVPLCICDKSKEVVLGKLGIDSLYDIWHSSLLNKMRDLQKQGRIREIVPCTKCQRSLTAQIGNQRDVKKK
ncbi:MAG: radical SAM protein [Candidatus Omnitrophica bacterium]|nr:radical SAM protein [Candidatus Omnitrophota bacterium]